jgi:carboxyl-terminal processing protease
LGDSRFGFTRTAELDQGGSVGSAVAFDDIYSHQPPQIEISPVALTTRDGHTTLKGTATDTDRLLDGYVFVGARKVFYRSNRNGADLKKMPFEADLPLRPGVNVITIIARENPDTLGRKTFIVRKDGPNGELLQTPKTEEDLSESSPGGGDD